MKKEIFLLFTFTDSIPSKIIKYFTKANYSHVTLSYDISKKDFYSFSRKYTYFVIPGGFIKENLDEGMMKRFSHGKCLLCKLLVSEESFAAITNRIEEMYNNNCFKYNLIGLLFCSMNKTLSRKNYYFCSEFIANILSQSNIISLEKHPSLYKPEDFLSIPGMITVFSGTIEYLSKRMGN